LYIPPNGYHSSVICFEKIDIIKFGYNPDELTPTGLICEIHSSIEKRSFDKPAIFTITYNDLDLTNYNEDKLAIFTWDLNGWRYLGGTIDKDNHVVTTAINQLGVYGLFENKLTRPGTIKDLGVSCQPRVFSPRCTGYDSRTAISFDLGKSAKVTIKIYNTAGRLIRVLEENQPKGRGTAVFYWDGKNQNGEDCVTGLYLVHIKTEELSKTKTVVVLNKN